MTQQTERLIAIILTCVTSAWLPPVGAEEATPTPSPTPEAAGEKDLSDVAGKIKLNTDAVTDDGSIVISNENLPELAGKGHVTEVTKKGPQQGRRTLSDLDAGGLAAGDSTLGLDMEEKKARWQAAYGQQLELLRNISLQIEQLDSEIPGLWRDFYSWDDPAYRDGVIKPQLDQALAQRQKLEEDLKAGTARLDEIKREARKAGAQPGWFRGFDPLPTPKPTRGVMPD